MDILDRIEKLLRLSESPNAHEAEAALLKAREMMARHKLGTADFPREPSLKVVRKKTEFSFGSLLRPWMVELSQSMAKNYCCLTYVLQTRGSQCMHIGLTGFEEDVRICIVMMRYVLNCIDGWSETLRDLCEGLYSIEDMERICNSYALGFIRGVGTAYERQSASHEEWGLALVPPEEARVLLSVISKVEWKEKVQALPNLYQEGFRDGIAFEPAKCKYATH